MKILFITSNRVGDTVLSLGALRALVAHYPEAQFTIACGPYAADLFRAVPRLERVILLKKKSYNRHWIALWKTCVGTKWDLILDLRNSLVSYLLRTQRRATHVRNTGQHKVIQIAAALGLASKPPTPCVWLDSAAESVAQRLMGDRPCLALGPAANWPPKQWPIERFAVLAQRLTAVGGVLEGASVVVCAEAGERAQLAPLLQSVPDSRRIEIVGQDLLAVAACLKRCRLFVGNDSGLMHLAAASSIPTLGLFGPGYEAIYGPWGERSAVVRTPESRESLLQKLPSLDAREPNLMEGLAVETVVQAATKLLQRQINAL